MTGPTAAVRDIVYNRDGYRCARCDGIDGPFALHHRRPRAAGGSKDPATNQPGNLILLCELTCHRDVESHRLVAFGMGWLVGQHQTPADVPLMYRGRRALLSDTGTITYQEDTP